MNFIIEPSKNLPIIEEVDICVLGGSCTGVFAAVRAARLGAKVAIIEKQNCFGGVATAGMVNIWHSLYDNGNSKQIIAGLTQEVIERLKKRNAVIDYQKDMKINKCNAYYLNTEELKIELDELVAEENISPYLHTLFCHAFIENQKITGIIIENKSGRQVIKAKMFIDATGDGDLCHKLGLDSYTIKNIQPPTTCAKFYESDSLNDFNLQQAIHEHHKEFGLKEDWGWSAHIPGMPDVRMRAETHVFDVDCSNGKDLTYSEIEGRRTIRAIMDIIRKYSPNGKNISLASLASTIGIRETRHIKGLYKITDDDLLFGKIFNDAIAFSSYRVDIHQSDRPGIIFKYLNGVQEYERRGYETEYSRWREESDSYPTFYQVPYRSLISDKYDNLIFCGRMIDAEEGAFGALRVMVTMNQLGEAAGTAAYLGINSNLKVSSIDTENLRETLKKGGSIIL